MSDRTIIRHEYVPEHILLSKEEAEEVFKRYHVKPNQLPFILASDPAIRNLNAKPGDIVKIIRRSPTAGVSIYYRYVVEG
ncbi:MAG: DNA-directed RNA polymerase subunit H [Candidatus Nitrosocaldus sp.]